MVTKQALSVIGCATLLSAFIAGCGNSGSTGSSGNSPSASTGQVTLTFWGGGQEEAPFFNQAIQSFEKAHPNIKVQWVMMGEEWKQKYPLALQGNNPPDIMWVTEPGFLDQAAKDGTLLALNSELQSRGMISRFSPSSWGFSTVNGTIYGVPFQMNTRCIAYNTDMLQRAGLKPPTTWDELLQEAKQLTGNGHYGIAFGVKDGWPLLDTWAGLAAMEGVNVFQMKNGKFDFTSKASVDALTYLSQLYKAGVFVPNPLSLTWDQSNQDFMDGKAAFMFDEGTWEVGNIARSAPNLHYGIIPWPKQSVSASGGKLYGGAAVALVVPKKAPHPKEALEFLDYITSLPEQKVYVKLTQQISPVTEADTSETMTDPHLLQFSNLLKNAQPYPAIPNEDQTRSILYKALSEAMAGQISPSEALQEATQQANAALGNS